MSTVIRTAQPDGGSRGLLLKAASVIPDLIIASLLWLVILALLPPSIGFMVGVLGITAAALVAAGLGEEAVIGVLYRARRPNASEAPQLAVAWRIATHHFESHGIRLRIVTHGPSIATAGRRHLLLRRDIVAAYCANHLTADQVAGLFAHGIGRLCHGHTRFDVLWTVWTIPWDLIRGLTHAVGRRLAWLPLAQFAWRIRVLVGIIAVILEAQAGRWPSAIVIAGFMGLSYLLPIGRQTWERHLCGRVRNEAAPGGPGTLPVSVSSD